jgi:hypothetical protein
MLVSPNGCSLSPRDSRFYRKLILTTLGTDDSNLGWKILKLRQMVKCCLVLRVQKLFYHHKFIHTQTWKRTWIRRGSLGSVTPGNDFYAKGWGIRLSDVTLRFQGSRTRVPACMTSPRENTPHMLYSGHTMSTDRVAEYATRVVYTYCLIGDMEWVSRQLMRKFALGIGLRQ